MAGLSTVAACESACLADSSCVAFDFDNNLNKCYKHPDGYLIYVQLNVASVDQYRRVACTPQGGSTTPSGKKIYHCI